MIRLIRPIRLIRLMGKKLLFFVLSLLVITTPLIYLTLLNSPTAKAAWYNDNWAYRKAVNIATHTAAENNVYINLTGANDIDTSDTARFQTDCGDLRFTDAAGKLLQYYVVSGCGSADTVVHVLFNTMPAGAQTVYYYYGNPTVQNGGNAADFATEALNYTFTTIGSEEKTPGPLVYFKFDDGTGTTTQDATTNNLDGTLSGPTWQTEDQCITGKCLLFDGTNDYVYAADNAILDNASSALTVGAWIKPNSYDASNWDIIATKWKDGSPNSYSWHFSLHQGKLSIYISSDGTSAGSELAVDTSVIETNKWSYVVFTVDTATDAVKLYKNGVQVGSTGSYTAASIPNSSAQLRIGTKEGSGEGSFPFPGFIDDVKIYPYARSATQIKTDYDSRGSVKGASAQFSTSSNNNPAALNNGLVGYWKLDESSTGAGAVSRSDSSGNGNTLTDTATVTSNPGKFGNAGQFTRTNTEYLSITDNSSLSTGDIDFTFSAWVYVDTTGGAGIFNNVAGKDGNTNQREWVLYTGNNTPVFRFAVSPDGTSSSNGIATSTTTLSTSTWYFVVAWHDSVSNTVNIQVNNGAVDSTSYSSGTADRTGDFQIGANIGGQAWDGRIDEARFYKRVLSSADRTALYNFAPGPVGYWKFDEKTGTAANDSSGNGNEATLTNTPTWTTGKYGAGINFAGSNQHVTRADDADFDFADDADVTIEAWIKHATTSTQEIILSKYQEAGYKIIMENDGDLTCALDYDNTWTPTDSATSTAATYDDNLWHHASCVKIGASSLNLYIDGVLIATDSSLTATNTLTNSDPLYIGIDADGTSNDWIGQIDDVKIYNYARTQKQIVEDMNAGHPAVGSPVGSAVGHWKFDEGVDNTCSGGTNDTCNSGSGGSTLDGAKTGATWTNSGKFGKALSFDGTDDDVNVGDPSNGAFDFGLSDSFTLTAWIKTSGPTGASDAQCIICKDVGSLQKSWWFRTSSTNVLQFLLSDGTNEPGVSGSTTVTTGQWIHVAAVRDVTSDTLRVYINGNQDGSTADTTTSGTENANSVKIGEFNSGATRQFNGTIDEPKIYRYALTVDELKIDMNRSSSQVLGSLSDKTGTGYEGGRQAANQEYCVPGDSTSCAAPVGEWKFDEKQGVTTFDTSGNASNGTWSGTLGSQWTQGKLGSGGKFNGSDNYIDIGDPSSGVLDFGTGDFTLSAWIKTSTTGVYQDILDKRTAPNGYLMGVLNTNKFGLFAVGGGNNVSVIGDTTVTDGRWHYVVATFDRDGNASVYLDGKSDATPVSMTTVGTVSTTGKAIIGYRDPALSSVWSYFNGQIDQVRAYNYLRTPAQIAWDYNRGAPVGHWKFDECQGTIAHDSSGNGNNGTITVGSAPNTAVGTCTGSANTMWKDGATGKYNSSLDFDGTDDYVSIADTANLRFDASTVDFSLFAWIKRTTTGTEYILSKEDADNDGYRLMFNSSNQVLCSEDATDVTSTSTITDTNWHLVGCTIDRDGNGQVYIDGRADGSTTAMGTDAMATTTALTIGTRSYTATSYITGQIDDVRIYNYALTATQVKTLMNQNAAVRFGPVTGSP